MADSTTVVQKMTVLVQELNTVYESREAQNIAKILLEDLFGIKFPQDELKVFPSALDHDFDLAKKRLLSKEPVQYVCEKAYFYGIPFYVNPAVLIPRPETEELVYEALQILKKQHTPPSGLKVIDVGTGSGCIPSILKKEMPKLDVQAIDVSEEAIAVAQKNASTIGVGVEFKHLDFLDQQAWMELTQYHMILSNPPYIPRSEARLVPENVQRYEPDIALFVSNEDPLIFYRLLREFAKGHLLSKGWILLEINQYAAAAVLDLYKNDSAFQEAEILQDLSGNERILRAQKC